MSKKYPGAEMMTFNISVLIYDVVINVSLETGLAAAVGTQKRI